MKRLFYGNAIILTFFLSFPAFADYVITLKNGRSVETANCWDERGEFKFQYQGGVVSIPKRSVVSLRKVEETSSARVYKQEEQARAPREAPDETRKAAVPEAARVNPVEASQEMGIQQRDKKEIDMEVYKKQKAYYTEQFDQAYQRYLDATSRKDREAKKQAWDEFNSFGRKVASVEDELKRKNNGLVPQ